MLHLHPWRSLANSIKVMSVPSVPPMHPLLPLAKVMNLSSGSASPCSHKMSFKCCSGLNLKGSSQTRGFQQNLTTFWDEVASHGNISSRDVGEIERCNRVEPKSFPCTSHDIGGAWEDRILGQVSLCQPPYLFPLPLFVSARAGSAFPPKPILLHSTVPSSSSCMHK